MACCPRYLCGRWYSAVVGLIKTSNNGKVCVADSRFEKEGKFIEIDATDEVLEMFKHEKVEQDYGIIVLKSKVPNPETKEDALVVAFVSFYRDHHNPDHDIQKRLSAEKALKEYDQQFEEFFSMQSSLRAS